MRTDSFGFKIQNSLSAKNLLETRKDRWLMDPELNRQHVEEFVRESNELTLCLRPARNSNGVHLRNALTKMLRDRLQQQQKQHATEKLTEEECKRIDEAIERFGRAFPNASVGPSAQFTFAKVGRDQLRVGYNGQVVDMIECRWLCENLAAVYLQPKPLIPALQEMVARELAEVVCSP